MIIIYECHYIHYSVRKSFAVNHNSAGRPQEEQSQRRERAETRGKTVGGLSSPAHPDHRHIHSLHLDVS